MLNYPIHPVVMYSTPVASQGGGGPPSPDTVWVGRGKAGEREASRKCGLSTPYLVQEAKPPILSAGGEAPPPLHLEKGWQSPRNPLLCAFCNIALIASITDPEVVNSVGSGCGKRTTSRM